MPKFKGNEGVKFSAENQPKNNGRPPKLMTEFTKIGEGFKPSQVKQIIQIAAALQPDEADKVLRKKETTLLERAVIKTLQKAATKGDYNLIKTMIEVFVGKPHQTQTVEQTGKQVVQVYKIGDQTIEF